MGPSLTVTVGFGLAEQHVAAADNLRRARRGGHPSDIRGGGDAAGVQE